MRSRMGRPVAAAVALVATLVVAAPASAITKPQRFSVLEIEGPTRFLDAGADENAPPEVGARFAFTNRLYAWAGTKRGKRVGRLEGLCTFTEINLARETATSFCTAEWTLPGGRILGAAFLRFSEDAGPTFRVPVIGGTGVYRNAKGYVSIRSIGREGSGKSADEFNLTP